MTVWMKAKQGTGSEFFQYPPFGVSERRNEGEETRRDSMWDEKVRDYDLLRNIELCISE